MKGETPGENRPRLDLGGRASPPHAPSIKCSVAEAGVRAFPSPKYRVFRAGLLLHVLPRLSTDPSGRDCCCMFSVAQVSSLPGGTTRYCALSITITQVSSLPGGTRGRCLCRVLAAGAAKSGNFRAGLFRAGSAAARRAVFSRRRRPSPETSGRDSAGQDAIVDTQDQPGGTLPGGTPSFVCEVVRAGLFRPGRLR